MTTFTKTLGHTERVERYTPDAPIIARRDWESGSFELAYAFVTTTSYDDGGPDQREITLYGYAVTNTGARHQNGSLRTFYCEAVRDQLASQLDAARRSVQS